MIFKTMEILSKSNKFIAINKPIGIGSQSDETGAQDAMTLLSAMLAEGGEDSTLFCVHRLDRTVGGVLVYARDKRTAAELSSLIQGDKFEKEYFAIVDGKCDGGIYSDLLFKDARRGKAFVVDRMRKGVKQALLTATPLGCADTEKGVKTLLRVRLGTGRFHQIRAQLSSRGFSITGDGKYGSRDNRAHTPALFSCYVSFAQGGEKITLRATPDISVYPWSLFDNELYL